MIEAGADSGYKLGERVFVPGANCFAPGESGPVHGLFGCRLEPSGQQCRPRHAGRCRHGTGRRAVWRWPPPPAMPLPRRKRPCPSLIIGHGVLGRLMARIAIAMGAPAPTVWETNPRARHRWRGLSGSGPRCRPAPRLSRDYGRIRCRRAAGQPDRAHRQGRRSGAGGLFTPSPSSSISCPPSCVKRGCALPLNGRPTT